MNRSNEAGALLAAVRSHLKEQRVSARSVQKENSVELNRLRRESVRFQDRLLQRVFTAAGIDLKEIRQRQKVESERIRNFARKQQRAILSRSKVIAAQGSQWANAISLHRERPDPVRNRPQKNFILDTAVRIDFMGITMPPQKLDLQTGTGPKHNFVKTNLHATSDKSAALRGQVLFLDYHFLWTSDRNGLLNSYGAVIPNGSWGMILYTDYDNSAYGKVRVDSFLSVSQMGAAGLVIPSSASEELLNKEDHANQIAGNGIFDLGPVNDIGNLLFNDTFITVGEQVLITVTVEIECLAGNGGEVWLDLASGAFEINVPFVALAAF